MKIGYFITARLKSSRLKRKIVLPLGEGTVLDRVIERCQQVDGVSDVVLCTSTNPQDAELFDYALKHSIKFYAGSEDDVLRRLLDAALYYGFDAFVSITADNPLHSIIVSNEITKWVKEIMPDFIFVSGLPIGLMPYFIKTKALEVAVRMKKDSDTEIWGPFVNRPDFFNIGYLDVEQDLFPEKTRLTCDYESDYKVIRSIYSLNTPGQYPDVYELSRWINSGLVELVNCDIEQRSLSKKTVDNIRNTFDKHWNTGMDHAKSIGYIPRPGSILRTLKF